MRAFSGTSALVTKTRGFDMLTEDTANALEKHMRVLVMVVTMVATLGWEGNKQMSRRKRT